MVHANFDLNQIKIWNNYIDGPREFDLNQIKIWNNYIGSNFSTKYFALLDFETQIVNVQIKYFVLVCSVYGGCVFFKRK